MTEVFLGQSTEVTSTSRLKQEEIAGTSRFSTINHGEYSLGGEDRLFYLHTGALM